MGAWGTAIFSDDLAADVRDSFRELIGDGLSPELATAKLKEEYASSLDDLDDAPVFWLALASTQRTLGKLLSEVLAEALKVIDDGEDLARWEEDEVALKKRQAVLAVLRTKLTGPQPAAKNVLKRYRSSTAWEVGQVIGYRLPNGQLCLFRVIGHHEDKGGRSPVVELLDWLGTEMPEIDAIHRCQIRRHRYLNGREGVTQFTLGSTSARDFPQSRVIETDYTLKPAQRPGGFTIFLWRFLDRQLHEYFAIGH